MAEEQHHATAVLCLAGLLLTACRRDPTRPLVGSKNFTEQVILGELVAQRLEAAGLQTARKLNLGGTLVCHQALVAGQIHAYVEYTGTALTTILQEPAAADRQRAGQLVRLAYRKRFNLDWLPSLGFSNSFAILVRSAQAAKLGLRTISDLARHAPRLQAAFGYEFLERPDGLPGLARTYGLRFASVPRVMDLALTYHALARGQVDVIAGDSTNGLIEALDLTILIDDKQFFPSYEAAPVISRAMAEQVPGFREALVALAGQISEAEMRRLNFEVDGRRKDPAVVVREFRIRKGL